MLSHRELKAFRERRNLTLRDVSEFAGISHSTISDIENGKIKLNEKYHKQIVDGINKAFFTKVKREDKRAAKEAALSTENEVKAANE